MVTGDASPLQSTFRLSYYTLLNLLSRSEGLYNTEYVISHSFHQFQYEKQVPAQKRKLRELEARLANAKADLLAKAHNSNNNGNDNAIDDSDKGEKDNDNTKDVGKAVRDKIQLELRHLELDMLKLILRPKICLPFLTYVLLHYLILE